jgi:hypothetical protein
MDPPLSINNLVDIFFSEYDIYFIPREENFVNDSLAVLASNSRIPTLPKLKFDVEVKYRLSIVHNVKYWKVFEDDLELKNFLESVDEFSAFTH